MVAVANDVEATIAGLDLLGQRIEDATRQIAADMGHILQAELMKTAPVGTPGNTTNAPGDLRRSMDFEGPYGSGAAYTGRVGPTVIYGRQRALGGPIYAKVAPALVFTKFGVIYRIAPPKFVTQMPNPFMQRAYMQSMGKIELDARARVTEAILGTTS